MNEAATEIQPTAKPRFFAAMMFARMGAGYAAMAVFSAAALLYSSVTLYQINRTTRQRIAETDIPAITSLVKMRASLLAQESFAGKYAIFKDPAFVQLFRQRAEDAVANLEVLERTGSVPDIGKLKRLYLDYQTASERLFARSGTQRRTSSGPAPLLLAALDELYIERQANLQRILDRADAQQKSTIRWGIAISCAGFLLAVLLARVSIFRVIRALGKLQDDTRRLAAGDFNYHPAQPAVWELNELVENLNQIAARVGELDQLNLDSQPLTRLPGNQAIERVLEQRLKQGAPFSFCCLELDNFEPYLAQYGFAGAGELLFETGVLVYKAVRKHGAAEDFAGHAGGDRFVMVLTPDREGPVCKAVINDFQTEVLRQLGARDQEGAEIERGGDSHPQPHPPMPAASITVLECDSRRYASAIEIAQAAVNARRNPEGGAGTGARTPVDQPQGELP